MLQDVIQEWGGTEVSPIDVYRDVFRLGDNEIQREHETPGSFKANPIAYWRNAGEKSGHFRIMFDDTFEETLAELQQADFAILNGLTYFGRRNVQEHASKMYAMIFDIDGVTDIKMESFLSGALRAEAYPVPNYIVLSGHGVHLYYVFEYPVPLFPNIKLQLKELKYALTYKMWNPYTSTEEKCQFQGINQGFRVIGGKTKEDAAEPVTRAFRLNTHPFNLNQLNQYVEVKNRIDETKLFKESKMTLEQAHKKYPTWYEKVVLNKDRTPRKWDIAGKVNGDNPYALYDWWLRQIETGASYRHRYFNIMCLAIYAVKCDVPEERLWKDAMALIPFLNDINREEPFTREDVECALECYDHRYCTFPIRDIEKLSGISVPKNKRNGRKQAAHIRRITLLRDDDYPDGSWRNKDGRPKGSGTAERKVSEWRMMHPDGKKADCIRDTGLDKKTVYKWWNAVERKEVSMEMMHKIENVKADLLNYGRQVVDFIVEQYPERIPLMLLTGELKTIAQHREIEATEMMMRLEKEYAKSHHSEDFMTNLQMLHEGRAIAQETVDKEILFKSLRMQQETIKITICNHEMFFERELVELFERKVCDSFEGSAESYIASNFHEMDLEKVFQKHSVENIRRMIIEAAMKDIALYEGTL